MTTAAAAFDYHTIASPSLVGATLRNAVEPTTVTTVAATGTIIYEINSQSVVYSTASATANWTLNIVYSKAMPLNAYLAIGQQVFILHEQERLWVGRITTLQADIRALQVLNEAAVH